MSIEVFLLLFINATIFIKSRIHFLTTRIFNRVHSMKNLFKIILNMFSDIVLL